MKNLYQTISAYTQRIFIFLVLNVVFVAFGFNTLKKFTNWLLKGSLCDYRAGYALSHPGIIIQYGLNEVKWAWQRVFRGWDDRVIWSIDYYIADHMPIWVETLKKNSIGIPVSMFEKDDFDEKNNYAVTPEAEARALAKWNAVLDGIAEGFRAYHQFADHLCGEKEYQDFEKKYNEAFDLFREHFSNLAD